MWCRRRAQGVEDVRLPVEWLRQCCIVDTPGTNAVIARHAQLTERIVPRADIIVFVTSADRPFSESERLFLSTIKSFHKKVVIVVNKTDLSDAVGADLGVMERDSALMRGEGPTIFSAVKHGDGVDQICEHILHAHAHAIGGGGGGGGGGH